MTVMTHAERLRNVLAATPAGQATIRAAAAHIDRLNDEIGELENNIRMAVFQSDGEIDAANARAANAIAALNAALVHVRAAIAKAKGE